MYIVQEIQTNNGVTALVPAVVYQDREAAESAFYMLCGYAVVSSVEKHTVMVYTEEGFPIAELCKCFKHEPVVGEPEAEEPEAEEPEAEEGE